MSPELYLWWKRNEQLVLVKCLYNIIEYLETFELFYIKYSLTRILIQQPSRHFLNDRGLLTVIHLQF